MSASRVDGRHLADHQFRFGAKYRLSVYDRLSAAEREAFGAFVDTPDGYGVLRPLDGGTFKAIDRDLALLLLTLREPGKLPRFYLRGRTKETVGRDVVSWVADGILEIHLDEAFRSGSDALGRLGQIVSDISATDRSIAALQYATTLGLSDRTRLAECLYHFGRLPLSPSWVRALPDPEAVLDALGQPRFAGWKQSGPDRRRPWITWSRPSGARLGRRRPRYKLYVSPQVQDLRRVFEVLPEALGQRDVCSFKVGASARSLLRPDKMVLYFCEPEELSETAHWLTQRLEGIAVHGVPFTAELADGWLSWGVDPPADHPAFRGRLPCSWRIWLTERLAHHLIEANRSETPIEPWRWALTRLRHDGVEIKDWAPTEDLWGQRPAGGTTDA